MRAAFKSASARSATAGPGVESGVTIDGAIYQPIGVNIRNFQGQLDGDLRSNTSASQGAITGFEPAFLRMLLVAIDAAAAAAAWSMALWLGALSPFRGSETALRSCAVVATLIVMTALLTTSQKLYRARVCAVRSVEISRLLRVSLLTSFASIAVASAVGLHVQARWAATGALAMFLLASVGRGVYARWLRGVRLSGRCCRPVILVGDNDEARELCQLTTHHPEYGVRLVGAVGQPSCLRAASIDLPWLGTIDDLSKVIDRASGVIIATSAVSAPQLNRVVRTLLEAGVHVQLSSGLAGISYRRLRPLPLGREPMFYIERRSPSNAQLRAKRIVDVALASVLLIISAPILATAAVVIKLGDRQASVIYRQQRVGRRGELFLLYKLRTMVPDAAARLDELMTANQRTGPLFKLAADPRVTRVGRFLRQTSIDELPQLVNVLIGNMSLVGPRPALADEVAEFDDALLARQEISPGITGLWQVEARDNPSFYAYRRLDLFYLENWSLLLDLAIIWSTVVVVAGRALRACTPRAHAKKQAMTRTLD